MTVRNLPAIATILVLLVLAWGVFRRDKSVTAAALIGLVAVAIAAIPLLLRTHALAALCGLESAAAVALSMLVLWRGARHYPLFGAVATLILGAAAVPLLLLSAAAATP